MTAAAPASKTDSEPTSLFLRACRGLPVERTPVWLLRQAGRYMPEYRALRERHSMLELVRSPELAAAGDAAPRRRVRRGRGDRVLRHPPAARRHGPRARVRAGRRSSDSQSDRVDARRRPARHSAGRRDDGRDARRDLARPSGARAARHPGDRVRGRALHARELRDRGRDVEGLLANEGVHALRARGVAPAADEARHRPGGLPARAGAGGRARRCRSSTPGRGARSAARTTSATSLRRTAPCTRRSPRRACR